MKKEYMDLFTGGRRKQGKRKQPLCVAACHSDAMGNHQYPLEGSASTDPSKGLSKPLVHQWF